MQAPGTRGRAQLSRPRGPAPCRSTASCRHYMRRRAPSACRLRQHGMAAQTCASQTAVRVAWVTRPLKCECAHVRRNGLSSGLRRPRRLTSGATRRGTSCEERQPSDTLHRISCKAAPCQTSLASSQQPIVPSCRDPAKSPICSCASAQQSRPHDRHEDAAQHNCMSFNALLSPCARTISTFTDPFWSRRAIAAKSPAAKFVLTTQHTLDPDSPSLRAQACRGLRSMDQRHGRVSCNLGLMRTLQMCKFACERMHAHCALAAFAVHLDDLANKAFGQLHRLLGVGLHCVPRRRGTMAITSMSRGSHMELCNAFESACQHPNPHKEPRRATMKERHRRKQRSALSAATCILRPGPKHFMAFRHTSCPHPALLR